MGKSTKTVDITKRQAIKEQEISVNFYRDSDSYTAIGQDTFDGKAIWAVKQEKLNSNDAKNFDNYDNFKNIDNVPFYRDFGDNAYLHGAYLTTKSDVTREGLAILDEWGNSMRFKSQGNIPPNENFYYGPAQNK